MHGITQKGETSMFYIFRRASSTGARQLAEALDGIRARNARHLGRIKPSDTVVFWGDVAPVIAGARRVNGVTVLNKLSELARLSERGVATVTFSRTRPQGEGWVGRTADHTGGLDLLRPPQVPDYYVRRENLVKEVRVHSFKGKSIRAGVKAVREGYQAPNGTALDVKNAHPWIRSWDGGWRISYSGEGIKNKHRDLAHAAVAALGLDFGAVDIGERSDGTLVVLEVNRAPGLEGGTIEAYAKAIRSLENSSVGGSQRA